MTPTVTSPPYDMVCKEKKTEPICSFPSGYNISFNNIIVHIYLKNTEFSIKHELHWLYLSLQNSPPPAAAPLLHPKILHNY